MTVDKKRKHRIRERMKATGESYTTARLAVEGSDWERFWNDAARVVIRLKAEEEAKDGTAKPLEVKP